MCGLVATIATSGGHSLTGVDLMLKAASHRGPDGSRKVWGTDQRWSSLEPPASWVAMGHARLSILDLSAGSSQPLVSECGRYSLVFNGEIYNFIELRESLRSLGRRFRTSGDTEVLLEALIAWDTAALNRLRGMFAFVFVDLETRRVVAARDRYGIKPLYVWRSREAIHFASEIKQFSMHPEWSPRLNNQAALEYLLYGVTDYSESTLFAEVNHVVAGSFVEIFLDRNDSSPKIRMAKWWMPHRTKFSGNYEDACNEYRTRFHDSLALHLRSDVPVASCLSGGLDSSAIVGSVAAWFSRDLQRHETFTATSEDSTIDETRFARLVNNYTNAIGHETQPTSERLWTSIDKLIWQQDEPFGSTSIFAQWCVFEQISRNQVKVALDGQGADEQLAGYNSFISLDIAQKISQRRWASAVQTHREFASSGRSSVGSVAAALAYRNLPDRLKRPLGRLVGVPSQNAGTWLSEVAIREYGVSDPFAPGGRYPASVEELSYDMVDRINLPMLLRFEDRNSMAFGVEARVPFVDHELMEFALSLPAEFRFRNGYTKAVLRDVVSTHLPSEVVRRKDKIGFQTAEASWLRSDKDRFLGEFDEISPRLTHLFTSSTREIFEKSLNGQLKNNQVAWRIFCLLRWMRVFGVK